MIDYWPLHCLGTPSICILLSANWTTWVIQMTYSLQSRGTNEKAEQVPMGPTVEWGCPFKLLQCLLLLVACLPFLWWTPHLAPCTWMAIVLQCIQVRKWQVTYKVICCQIWCKHNITWSKSMDVVRHMLLAPAFHQSSAIKPNHQRENYSNQSHHCYFSHFVWSRLHLSSQDWLQCSISVNNLGRNQDLTGYCGSATFSHRSIPTAIS